MKKQTKVLLAAALFTLGASFSSMAALKNGTWQLNEDGWQYADKDGDYVEDEWCYSYGVEYYIDEEGYLGSSEWVEEDGYSYYVQSDGSKTKSAWKYIYADGEEDDSDAEEAWFYFDSKGRMVDKEFKYQIGDYYYSFGDDGKMLTGWIDQTTFEEIGDTVNSVAASAASYHDPESGAMVRSSWIHVFPWTADEDECYEGDDEAYYYTNNDGEPRTNEIKKIDGHYYAFGANGQMLDEWVILENDVYTSANAEKDMSRIAAAEELYYATEDIGYLKTNQWYFLEDAAEDTNWFYFDKLGKAFMSTASNAEELTTNGYRLELVDGEKFIVDESDDNDSVDTAVYVATKKINGTYYYFDQYGAMLDGLVEINGELMYLTEGARTTGKVSIEDDNENEYTFCFADETDSAKGYKKYVAVTGNMDGYLYDNGQLVTSNDSDVYLEHTLYEGKAKETTFVVDYRGKIQHKDDKEYELATGKTKSYKFNTTNDGWNEDCVTSTNK